MIWENLGTTNDQTEYIDPFIDLAGMNWYFIYHFYHNLQLYPRDRVMNWGVGLLHGYNTLNSMTLWYIIWQTFFNSVCV